ncbi:MAG: hypothetical protein O9253_01340 [Aquidulcibacter sp.]|nr:hypothetical protein [Aquidulcibacter sp.]
MAQAKRTCVVIAGMHRSGTSALARVLNLLGCGLANKILGAEPANETGHWEPYEIIMLNETILESAGSAWDDWTAISTDWLDSTIAKEFKIRGAHLFSTEYTDHSLTVVKDPRLARLLPFWLGILRSVDVDPVVMIPIRNPLEVAQSLQARNGFDTSYSELLWLRHVLDAEVGSRGVARHFSTYDQLLESWTSLISSAETKLGFKFPRRSARTSEEVDAYLAERHRHHRHDPKALMGNAAASDLLKSTYAIMLKWSETGEDPKDYAQLDSVRSELDRSAGTFSRLIYRGKKAVEEVNGLRHILAEHDQQAANLRGEFEHISNIANQREHEIGALQNQVSSEHARRAELEALRANADAERATLESALHAIEERLQQTQTELAASLDHVNAVQAASQAERAESIAKLDAAHAEISSLQAQVVLDAVNHSELEAVCNSLRGALEAEQAAVKDLTDQVALLIREIDATGQACEAKIQAKTVELNTAQSGLEETIKELHEALVVSSKTATEVVHLTSCLEQMEIVMRQRGAELDDVNGELKRVMGILHVEKHEQERMFRTIEGLKDQVRHLLEGVDNKTHELAAKTQENQHLLHNTFELKGELDHLKMQLVDKTNGLLQGLIGEPYRLITTPGAHMRRKAALLKRVGVIDPVAYLEANPDVAEANIEPEIHYLNSGYAEGRNITK